MGLRLRVAVVGLGVVAGGVAAWGQAAALPSAGVVRVEGKSGRELMGEMVSALGGEAWLGRGTWVVEGRVAKFYKGEAAGSQGFEESVRLRPFGERFVRVAHYGGLVAKDHRDVAEVWTKDAGWEITYKGARAMGAGEVEEFERRREHSLEVVVGEWLGETGVEVRDVGEEMVESERVDVVEVVRESGDAVTVRMDARTHLPVSLSWRWRDAEFKDWDTEAVEFADWHAVQGVETPYAVTEEAEWGCGGGEVCGVGEVWGGVGG